MTHDGGSHENGCWLPMRAVAAKFLQRHPGGMNTQGTQRPADPSALAGNLLVLLSTREAACLGWPSQMSVIPGKGFRRGRGGPQGTGTEVRSESQTMSAFPGDGTTSVMGLSVMGLIVRASTHLWTSAWPSAKLRPPARLWLLAG